MKGMNSWLMFVGVVGLLTFAMISYFIGDMIGSVSSEYDASTQLIITFMIPAIGIALLYGFFGGG